MYKGHSPNCEATDARMCKHKSKERERENCKLCTFSVRGCKATEELLALWCKPYEKYLGIVYVYKLYSLPTSRHDPLFTQHLGLI